MSLTFGPGAYRFMLAMLVVVHHTSSLGLGAGAVYVFFCLSGYWMHTVWEKKYAKAEHGYRTFMLARLIRLLPLFWLANVVGYAVEVSLGEFPLEAWSSRMREPLALLHFVFSHLFLFGYYLLDHMVIAPAWSLDIELQFYVLLPLMAMAMRWLGWWVIPMAAAVSLGLQSSHVFGTVFSYVLFFYLGMWASHSQWVPSQRLVRSSVLLAALVMGLLIAVPATHAVLIGGLGQNEVYWRWNDFANAVIAVILLPTTIWSAERKVRGHDRMLGDMSYAVYLLHGPLVGIYSAWFGGLPVLQRLPYWVMTILAICAVAWLAWRFIDKPVMDWRERYLQART